MSLLPCKLNSQRMLSPCSKFCLCSSEIRSRDAKFSRPHKHGKFVHLKTSIFLESLDVSQQKSDTLLRFQGTF